MSRVLFVDDEPRILETFRRNLRKQYDVHTAVGPEEGLRVVKEDDSFAVIVSDLKMPGMDGITFLSTVHSMSPDSVRIMLTGYADVDNAIAAVNEGHVFRFLTKPCTLESLSKALDAGLEQHRLVTSERELLRGTLRGSIKVLSEVLSLVNPEAFGRSERIRRRVNELGRHMGFEPLWMLDLAAMLSQIGCVGIAEEIVRKHNSGKDLTGEERKAFNRHPQIAAGLLSHIPRLEEVGEIIAHQNEKYDEKLSCPLGSRLLKIAIDYDRLEQDGYDCKGAVAALRTYSRQYDPKVLEAFVGMICKQQGPVPRAVELMDIREGMVLAEDVYSKDNVLLLVRGQEVTSATIERLRGFAVRAGVQEPLYVHSGVQN